MKVKTFRGIQGQGEREISRELVKADYPQDCIYTVQEKAWVDGVTLKEWAQKVLKPFAEART